MDLETTRDLEQRSWSRPDIVADDPEPEYTGVLGWEPPRPTVADPETEG